MTQISKKSSNSKRSIIKQRKDSGRNVDELSVENINGDNQSEFDANHDTSNLRNSNEGVLIPIVKLNTKEQADKTFN